MWLSPVRTVPTGMASYLELHDFAVNSVCNSKLLPEQLVDVHTLGANIEEIWQKLDTPPLSPEHDSDGGSSPSSSDSGSQETSEDDSESQEKDQKLLDELLACHQLLSGYSSDEDWSTNTFTLPDFPRLQSNLLIQDCMWNSQMYEPRNQLSTPVPSPPPSPQSPAPAELGLEEVEVVPQADCVEPSAVFLIPPDSQAKDLPEQDSEKPQENVEMPAREKERRSVTVTVSSARIQPQATAPSESGEYSM